MKLLHSVQKKALADVLKHGLQYGHPGNLSQQPLARRTNEFLDKLRPTALLYHSVSRADCIYLYYADGDKVLDITDGQFKSVATWNPGDDQTKVSVDADIEAAYVSDLDAYDQLAQAIKSNAPLEQRERLAVAYWATVQPLAILPRVAGRLEIMYAQAIPSEAISMA